MIELFHRSLLLINAYSDILLALVGAKYYIFSDECMFNSTKECPIQLFTTNPDLEGKVDPITSFAIRATGAALLSYFIACIMTASSKSATIRRTVANFKLVLYLALMPVNIISALDSSGYINRVPHYVLILFNALMLVLNFYALRSAMEDECAEDSSSIFVPLSLQRANFLTMLLWGIPACAVYISPNATVGPNGIFPMFQKTSLENESNNFDPAEVNAMRKMAAVWLPLLVVHSSGRRAPVLVNKLVCFHFYFFFPLYLIEFSSTHGWSNKNLLLFDMLGFISLALYAFWAAGAFDISTGKDEDASSAKVKHGKDA